MLQLHRKIDHIDLWPVSHTVDKLKRERMMDFTSFSMGYLMEEEVSDPQKRAYKFFSGKKYPEGNITSNTEIELYGNTPALICDFNRRPHCWAIGQVQDEKFVVLYQIHSYDAITSEQAHKACKFMQELGISHIELFGDATGKNKGRKKKADWDDVTDTLEEYDITFERKFHPKSNPLVDKRIKEVNNAIHTKNKDDEIVRNLLVDERCTEVVDDFKFVIQDDNGKVLEKEGDRGHYAAAIGYWVYRVRKGGLWFNYVT